MSVNQGGKQENVALKYYNKLPAESSKEATI